MDANTYYRVQVRWLALTALVALIVTGVLIVVAQDNGDGLGYDGRINIDHHFGGDALYCVDRNGSPTGQYSDGEFGGIQLLNINGQPLWFVASADITAATAGLVPGGDKVLIATGNGTYGPVALYGLLNTDGDLFFQFTGFDEHGKPNQIEFKFCEPVGVVPQPEGNPGSSDPGLCSASEVDEASEENDQSNSDDSDFSDAFLECYNLACPDTPIDSKDAEECFCSQYPDSLPCSRNGNDNDNIDDPNDIP